MKRYIRSAANITSWTDYLPEDVATRLANCRSTKSDIKPLVDAKWRRMKDLGKQDHGFVREDALVAVLDLLDANGCDYELTQEEYDDLKKDLNVKAARQPRRKVFWPNGKQLTDDELLDVLMYFYGEDMASAKYDAETLDDDKLNEAAEYYAENV